MKIVILEPLAISKKVLTKHVNVLQDLGHEVIIYEDRPETEDEIVNRAKDAEVVMLTNLPFPGMIIDQLDNLKMISVAFTGFDHVDIEKCKEKGIAVSNSAGYSTDAVAELTFGLIISLYRYLSEGDKATRDGKDKTGLIGNEIRDKVLGVVGTGAIGTRVAQIGNAFGCELLGYNRSEKQECKKLGMKYVSLDELLEKSDIVSVHLPLNDESTNLLSEKEFAKMKSSAILINTARGGVVNEEDLAQALNDDVIAGAGIDVYEQEPPLPEDYVLLKAKNTVLTPHVGFATTESLVKRSDIAFANIVKWLDGKPQNRVI